MIGLMRWARPLSSQSRFHDPEDHRLMENESNVDINHQTGLPVLDGESGEDELAFRHLRGVDTVDLFYDLLVVASLATVTARSEIFDAATLKAYLCFFTLLWVTWLQSTLFGIRCPADSRFRHVHKAISWITMTVFVVCTMTYDIIHIPSTIQGFKALSSILITSRLILATQYIIVLWNASNQEISRLPLIYSIGSMMVSAMAFLLIFWGLGENSGCYLAWYGVCVAEATSIIGIFTKWRMTSANTAHLVERLGLLTVVIMAKGVLSLSRTTYKLFDTVKWPLADNLGELVCSMLLMYFIFMLYFNHAENDRFAWTSQRIWTILHYPLHVAILVMMEDCSFLILSRVINQISGAWQALHPLHDFSDLRTFFEGYISSREVASDLLDDIDSLFNIAFRNRTRLLNLYNYTEQIEEIKHIAQPFNSFQWQLEAGTRIDRLWNEAENAIASVFGVNGLQPLDHRSSAAYQRPATDELCSYFYLSAGSLLLILALMSLVSKKDHEQSRWLSIWANIVIGLAFLLPVSSIWVNSGTVEAFYSTRWTVVLVVFGYFTVALSHDLARRTQDRQNCQGQSEREDTVTQLLEKGVHCGGSYA
ncbi:uncharacterized protein A1O9_01282 [Exophiala aquamarina CBS 119918]|uniref:Uncharacterized protein n=1 Tax=Exophiala aquamarina CBS 119918 TaxID=1182545 RepID=A0A072Q5Y0_9EURO|nr:uncharacterized protein A1O9_01282 [Exophiala aquamarina CBS 119918]KEF63305.1 hypothetical protein A1O9_01282 [Exophiala aquamarina CBS 119918]